MAVSTSTWVEAAPFRAHLQHLMAVGDVTVTEVATLAGVPPRAAESLLNGRQGRPLRRISPETARSLLLVRPEHAVGLRSCFVHAPESRSRLRRLLAQGQQTSELAAELGVTTRELDELADGTTVWCSGLLALRLVILARDTAAAPGRTAGGAAADAAGSAA